MPGEGIQTLMIMLFVHPLVDRKSACKPRHAPLKRWSFGEEEDRSVGRRGLVRLCILSSSHVCVMVMVLCS